MKNRRIYESPMLHVQTEANRIVEDLDRDHGRALFATVCKQCRTVFDADECLDVYQEVLLSFLLIVRKKIAARTFDPENPVRLAFGVATRVIRNAKRRARRTVCGPLTEALVDLGTPSAESDDPVRQNMLAAFSTLTPSQRRVVDAYLAYMDDTGQVRGGRYQRIAKELGMEPNIVRSVFRRSINKIRSYMKLNVGQSQ